MPKTMKLSSVTETKSEVTPLHPGCPKRVRPISNSPVKSESRKQTCEENQGRTLSSLIREV